MKSITRDDVQNLMKDEAYLIEVLPAKEYDEAHLAHARNIPLKQLSRMSVDGLESTRPVISVLLRLSVRFKSASRVAVRNLGLYRCLRLRAGENGLVGVRAFGSETARL